MSVLRELRNKAGMTQKELAERCGVVRQTISNIELGINKPSIKLAKELAQVFGVHFAVFFEKKVILNDKEDL